MANESNSGELTISSRGDLENWFNSLPPKQEPWVATAIAARAALRGIPQLASVGNRWTEQASMPYVSNLGFSVFFACAVARVATRYPHLIDTLPLVDALNATSVPMPITIDRTFQSVVHAANGAMSSVHRAAIIETRDARYQHLRAASFAAAFFRAGDPTSLAALSHDVSFIASGSTAQALAFKPLWPIRAPDGMLANWLRLKAAFPRSDDWQAWIDWYERRLEGVADPEEIELVFATVPDKERAAGAAAANRWIKERLEELQKKESSESSPRPVENLPSPFTFGRNAAGQITIVAGPQNTPVITFPGDEATHRRWLQTARKLSERLIADLRAQKFNVRSAYVEGLERYVADLPSEPGAGDFLLADAEARMLRSLFAAERHLIPEPFAARLKTTLESHFALLGFYPEVERYIGAARKGQMSAPLPQEAINGFGDVVRENTPQAFAPEVSRGLGEVERQAPKIELEPEDIRHGPAPVEPPAYPYDEPDPEKSHWFGVASSFNALYIAVLETAKKEPSKIVHWVAIEELLRPYAIMIIEWLKTFTSSAF